MIESRVTRADDNIQVLDKIKRRTNSNKLCNNHYLRGPCAKGDDCCFEHKYKATEEDMKAIAFLTRLNPCTSGQDCDLEFCIYGHHCPSVTMVGKEVSLLVPLWSGGSQKCAKADLDSSFLARL